MSRPYTTGRRGFLARLTAFAGALFAGSATGAAALTPRATEGPFYPAGPMRFPDVDNDLVRVAGMVRAAGGEVIHLSGRVLDAAGAPQAGLRVEIWQCDVNGEYLHPGDDGGHVYDTGFQGFGHDITDADGRYSFRTIRPTVYPGRTPHIHVKVMNGPREVLTTQFYLADHPDNARDRLFNRLSPADRDKVTMRFSQGRESPETTVDLVI
jgi:protocatechuate 3,4-dioxygenase beta subunit